MHCKEWADANSELFKEAHDETVHKNSYKRKLYELISASQVNQTSSAALSFRAEISTGMTRSVHGDGEKEPRNLTPP